MTFVRKTSALAGLALTAALALAPTGASAVITDLPSCYDHVITSCNNTSKHPDACIDNATNACDEEFGNASLGTSPKLFLNPTQSKPARAKVSMLLLPAVQQAREAARRN